MSSLQLHKLAYIHLSIDDFKIGQVLPPIFSAHCKHRRYKFEITHALCRSYISYIHTCSMQPFWKYLQISILGLDFTGDCHFVLVQL
jgi:hypothetical protein